MALALAVSACGDTPLYDPYYDPWAGIDPWDPCSIDPTCYAPPGGVDPSSSGYDPSTDPWGGTVDPSGDPGGSSDPGSALVMASPPSCSAADGSCLLRSTAEQVQGSMASVIGWARAARNAASQAAPAPVQVYGPVAVDRSPAHPGDQLLVRLTVTTTATGATTWLLEARPPADGGAFRPVFSGSSSGSGDRRSGTYDIDVGALGAVTGAPADPGDVSGTFSRQPDEASTEIVVAPASAPSHPVHLRAQVSRSAAGPRTRVRML